MSGTAAVTEPPVITAWTAVSPFGIGREAFAEGLRDRRPTAGALDQETWRAADDTACLVPDFDVRGLLGKKGTRSMDRVTGLAVATVGRLLEDSPRNREVATGEGAALVLGTTIGSVQSQMDFVRDSFTGERPYLVDPARFPNAVMNCAAGQSAIWHRLKGPNTTIAGGRAAGLYALSYTRRLLRFGRAATVLCGAVEEFSTERSWLGRRTREAGTAADPRPAGEGCGLLLIEPGGDPAGGPVSGGSGEDRPVLAELLAVEMGIALGGDVRTPLVRCLRRALERAGVRPGDLWAVSGSEAPGTDGQQEQDALADVLGDASPLRLSQAALIGDTGAAAATLQVAGVLAAAEDAPEASGQAALVTSVDRDGAVGCAVLRLR